jgi:phosphoribosylformylglycinamidine synthase
LGWQGTSVWCEAGGGGVISFGEHRPALVIMMPTAIFRRGRSEMTSPPLDHIADVRERRFPSTMLILRGSPAFSQFRIQKLLQDLNAAGLAVRAIAAEFVHVAEVSGELSGPQREVLEKLLTYGPSRASTQVEGLLQVVAPRPGTISPWSSKATDIAHICGLSAVRRIERAIAYHLDIGSAKLSVDQRATLAAKLHDRMTQAVFNEVESVEVLFRH